MNSSAKGSNCNGKKVARGRKIFIRSIIKISRIKNGQRRVIGFSYKGPRRGLKKPK